MKDERGAESRSKSRLPGSQAIRRSEGPGLDGVKMEKQQAMVRRNSSFQESKQNEQEAGSVSFITAAIETSPVPNEDLCLLGSIKGGGWRCY